MSFRLDLEDAIAGGVARCAREQIDQALSQLGDPERGRDAAIHEARKSCKRLRGLLRLVRSGLGDKGYRRENAALRAAARRLSALRDADALLETFDGLALRVTGEIDRRRIVPVRRALAARAAELSEDDLEPRIAAFCADLAAVRARIASWPRANDFGVLATGLKVTYKRARAAMQAAYDAPSGERFHDWRKRVKDHRYHLELLVELWPRPIEARRKEVKTLGAMLGEEHDLAVLEARLAAGAEGFGDRSARLVAGLSQRRRAELRAAMRPLGRRLFAERPGALARRFEVYGQTAQDGAEDGGALEVA